MEAVGISKRHKLTHFRPYNKYDNAFGLLNLKIRVKQLAERRSIFELKKSNENNLRKTHLIKVTSGMWQTIKNVLMKVKNMGIDFLHIPSKSSF